MRRGCLRFICLTFAVPLCLAAAQVPQGELPAKNNVIATVPFFVVESHGNSTSTQINLSVLDNKNPAQSVAIHTARELPLRLGVLIDTSNSEKGSNLYQPGVQGLSELLNQLTMTTEDKVFVVSFAITPDVSVFMTRDELLKFKVDLTPGGASAIQDAIYIACKDRMQSDPTQPARRVLVVLSDGGDNMSHVTRDETVAIAQKAGAVIFTVSTSENPNGNLDSSRLEQFADKTGGQAFLHLNRKDLPKVFSSIKEQIENMYAVTFVPAAVGRPGEYHSIELKSTSDKKIKVRAPKGYYAGVQ